MKLRNFVLEELAVERDENAVFGLMGINAWRFPKIAELSYVTNLNAPISEDQLRLLETELAEKLNFDIPNEFYELYSSFNGLQLLKKFSVYGIVPEKVDRSNFQAMLNVPFDIWCINTFGRPKFAPASSVIVGTFGDGDSDYQDCITSEGNFITGRFHESPDITNDWTNIRSWLKSRFDESLIDLENCFPDDLPKDLSRLKLN